MNKVLVITKREFILNITRWQFWVYTLFLPFVIALIFVGSILASTFIGLTLFADDEEEKEKPLPYAVGIVDDAQMLDLETLNGERAKKMAAREYNGWDKISEYVELPEFLSEVIDRKAEEKAEENAGPAYISFPDWQAGMTALEERQVRGVLAIPEDYRTNFQGKVMWYDKDNHVSLRHISRELRHQILGPLVGETLVEIAVDPFDGIERTYYIQATDKKKEAEKEEDDDFELSLQSIILAIVYMGTMLTVITASSDRLLRGLAEEKQNRVIETLLSSVTSNQLMAGKVLGLGALSLIQFVIWFGTAFIPAIYLITFITFDMAVLLAFMLFMVLGYLLNAVSILGLGSMGNNYQEASQWAAIFIIANAAPFFAIPFLMIEPAGIAAKVLTYIPITAPMVVMFRMGADTIAYWEVGLSFLVLLISCLIALRISAKMFRMGLLMTGQKPTPKTIWRMWRVS
jgi:ABC-2 type transport system permease protein